MVQRDRLPSRKSKVHNVQIIPQGIRRVYSLSPVRTAKKIHLRQLAEVDQRVYSVLSATTGSFLAALREGMMPANTVSTMLMPTRISATCQGR